MNGDRLPEMAFYVYILRCADGLYYTGHTDNVGSRLAAHEQGEIPGYTQTKTRRPVELVFAEEFPSRKDALGCERQIKGWSRAKKKALIARDWARLVDLARTRPGADVLPVRSELVEP
jgi:predicted GIY-YIG superfamily endonuclease